MPRGVYDRKKKKGDAEQPKAAPVAKTKSPKGPRKKTEVTTSSATPSTAPAAPAGEVIDAGMAFNCLGANLTTLTEAYTRLDANGTLQEKVGKEISSTIDCISALRQRVFGHLVQTSEEPVGEVVEDEQAAPAALPKPPVATPAPVLPMQPGNTQGFHPPAPPVSQG